MVAAASCKACWETLGGEWQGARAGGPGAGKNEEKLISSQGLDCLIWEEGCTQVQLRLSLEGTHKRGVMGHVGHNQGNVALRDDVMEPES